MTYQKTISEKKGHSKKKKLLEKSKKNRKV